MDIKITLTITKAENRILDSWLGKDIIQGWLQHALNNKIRQRVDASICECSNLNPSKMNMETKLNILDNVSLPSKQERDAFESKTKG